VSFFIAVRGPPHSMTLTRARLGETRVPWGYAMSRFYGIYRANVVSALDPANRRRLQIQVPDILGTALVWAEPCVPPKSRAQPHTGSAVWVQFEAGDPDRPVWVGTRP
jgi:hypothetical protein